MTLSNLHIMHGRYILTCLKLYGVSEQDCEDVRQDIYVHLLETKHKIENTYVKGFCAKIARNAAIDYARKNKNTLKTIPFSCNIDNDPAEVIAELDAKSLAKWNEVIGNVNTDRIEKAIELSQEYECKPGVPIYEIIVDLLLGLSLEDIGGKYCITKSAVHQWLQKWYTYLKKEIKNE